MAARRPLTALTCVQCQRWVLRSFIASIGEQTSLRAVPRPIQQRAFSRISPQRKDALDEVQSEEHVLNEINEEVAQETASSPSQPAPTQKPTQPHLPWYLQIQAQNRIQSEHSPLTPTQTLPPLPDNPPTLLSPLLTHISTALGLSDLTLLDLRHLTDPPPALGANLLMLIATARSERHLHSSADKLCRWLRSEFKLSPYADGLLGRGELKILMRRKAKRGKILGAVSGVKGTAGGEIASEGDVGDGVRTGWVCVNAGRVEGGEVARGEIETEGFVGFGKRSGGTAMVVQMFTEDKREEIGLETLWGEVLARAEKRKQREMLREREEDNAEETAGPETESSQTAPGLSLPLEPKSSGLPFESVPQVSNQSSAQQLRGYHTSSRRPNATTKSEVSLREENVTIVAPPSPTPTLFQAGASVKTLDNLLIQLTKLPRAQALETLGPNLPTATQKQGLFLPSPPGINTTTPSTEEATESTFLTTFYNTIPAFPTTAHWHAHIALLAFARQLRHPEAHSPVLLAQLSNMQIAGLIPEERTFVLVLKAILSPLGAGSSGREGYDGVSNAMPAWKIEAVLGLLEEMEGCGYDGLSEPVLGIVGRAFGVTVDAQRDDTHAMGDVLPALHIARLRRLLSSDREAFWRAWHSYPQRFLARSAGMYAVLFSALAHGELGVGSEARELLRDALEAMECEVLEVSVEGNRELAAVVREAIQFVEVGEVGREWAGLHERCGRVVGLEV